MTSVLRVASYNLHKCRGMFGRYAPERNLQVIAQLNADVIALQEVDYRYSGRPEALPRARIEAATGLVPVSHGTTGTDSLGWHGQTILIRPEKVDEAEVRRLPLPGLEPRGALALRLESVTVLVMHLGLARSSRRAQLSRLATKAVRIAGDNYVLTGDFNEWRDERGLEPLNDLTIVAPGPSWPAVFPRLRYDRIAVSSGLTVLDSGVLDNPLARKASDHLPVWADLRLPSG